MNSEDCKSDIDEVSARCYRLAWWYLAGGMVFTPLFVVADVLFTYSAYFNIDGSFPHRKQHALAYCLFWSFMVLMSILLVVAYFRERLFIANMSITKYGLIVRRKINVADVNHISWKGMPQAGRIIVRTHLTGFSIYLGNYTGAECNQLIRFFHCRFPADIQAGWAKFSQHRSEVAAFRPQISSRLVLLCAFLLLLFGVLYLYLRTITHVH